MRIGIVMPAFNVAPYIGDAMRSVLRQTHRDWTLVIVDDGSTDRTAAIASGFGDRRVTVISQPNAGVSAARNRGLAAVLGETGVEAVLFLDADDWLTPAALTILAETLTAHPTAAAAAGAYTKTPGRHPVRHPPSGDLLRRLLVRNLFANGGHLLIRRAALEAAGVFHTGLRYGEDWEYWVRLAQAGPFAAARSRAPLLLVRERHGGAYLTLAARRDSFVPCMMAIFGSPALAARLGEAALDRLRRRAEAENDWIRGRELIRHGRLAEGRRLLLRSVRAAPGPKRLALLALGSLPMARIGPFRPYPPPQAE